MQNDDKKKGEEGKTKKRLQLRRETLRKLNDRALEKVYGGRAMDNNGDDMGDQKKPPLL